LRKMEKGSAAALPFFVSHRRPATRQCLRLPGFDDA
jgi:hypothetical protein